MVTKRNLTLKEFKKGLQENIFGGLFVYYDEPLKVESVWSSDIKELSDGTIRIFLSDGSKFQIKVIKEE